MMTNDKYGFIKRKREIGYTRFLLLTAISMAFLLGLEYSKSLQKDPILSEKITAARLMEKALTVIKKERLERGITIDPQIDPNETGIIGWNHTELTTTLGSPSSKRTSTNPNFAGVVVEMLHRAGVKAGDDVAISFSGSFPALNIAIISAVHTLRLNPVILSSVGASMYGANDPRLTWLDIETILREHGIWPYASVAASLGGIVELRNGLDGKGIELGIEAIRRNGVAYIDEQGVKTLQADIDRRLNIYDRSFTGRKPAIFINTGGSLTSLGNNPEVYSLSSGLLTRIPLSNNPERGIIFRMAERGVSVIHFLNIKKMAARYGLPIDPIPLPSVPSGGVMRPQKYSILLALSGLITVCLLGISVKHWTFPSR